MQKLS